MYGPPTGVVSQPNAPKSTNIWGRWERAGAAGVRRRRVGGGIRKWSRKESEEARKGKGNTGEEVGEKREERWRERGRGERER